MKYKGARNEVRSGCGLASACFEAGPNAPLSFALRKNAFGLAVGTCVSEAASTPPSVVTYPGFGTREGSDNRPESYAEIMAVEVAMPMTAWNEVSRDSGPLPDLNLRQKSTGETGASMNRKVRITSRIGNKYHDG